MKNATRELAKVEYTAAAVKVLNFCVKPGTLCFTLHWHDRVEVIRIKKGNMAVEYGGNTVLLHEGELMIFSPRMAHKGYTQDSPVEYDVLMFDVRSFYNETAVCLQLLPQFFNGSVRFHTVISATETVRCVDRICHSSQPNSLDTTALVYQLLHLLFENHVASVSVTRKTDAETMVEYIEDNFASELTIAAMGDRFGYSSEHFCRKFKEATGITPMTYLKIYRLEQALKKIKHSESNIGEIAAQCGFSDANYFTRCFKAHYGVPPRFYRAKEK
ncbi:MAG: helix-turn-helix transcriptional regulator [Clostridia bacterium]|nr:helix-turn-helix transcriptional regulator [Clostridia bacterium]